MRVAVFDLDGTLIRGQSYAYLLRWLWQRGWRRPRIVALLAAGVPSYVLRKVGWVDRLRNQERWARGMAWLWRGVAVDEVRALMADFVACLQPWVRPEVLAEMHARRREGCRIILASTVVAPLLEQVAKAVNADGWVATPLEVRDGHFTGRLAGLPCNGWRKVEGVEALVRGWGSEVDWAGSCAYSDGFPDVPLLERAGNPTAVAPDDRLREVARARGWRILDPPNFPGSMPRPAAGP